MKGASPWLLTASAYPTILEPRDTNVLGTYFIVLGMYYCMFIVLGTYYCMFAVVYVLLYFVYFLLYYVLLFYVCVLL
jgi:hypothetical protein